MVFCVLLERRGGDQIEGGKNYVAGVGRGDTGRQDRGGGADGRSDGQLRKRESGTIYSTFVDRSPEKGETGGRKG